MKTSTEKEFERLEQKFENLKQELEGLKQKQKQEQNGYEGFWMIYFQESGLPPEIYDSKIVALQRYFVLRDSYNCGLFKAASVEDLE